MKEAISSQNMTDPIGFFCVGYYIEVSSSLLYGQELVHYLLSLTILSSPFSSSTFRSSPNASAPMLLVSKSVSHTVRCSKHNTINKYFHIIQFLLFTLENNAVMKHFHCLLLMANILIQLWISVKYLLVFFFLHHTF